MARDPLAERRCIVATVVLRLTCNSPGGRNETAGRRIGVSAYGEKRNGGSACGRNETAGRHAWRGRVALPRDRRCTSGNFPLLITPPQPFVLRSLLFACSSSMDVQRRSRGSATLPRHACRPADAPTRRHADTPFRFCALAHAGGISTGACRNLRIYAHKTWERTRTLFLSHSNPNLPMEACSLATILHFF